MASEMTSAEIKSASTSLPASAPPPVLAGHPWSKRGQPSKNYEEWCVAFGDLELVLYHDTDPASETFNLWGAEIAGENIGELGQDESPDVEVIVALLRERLLLTARAIVWAAGRLLHNGGAA